MSTTPPRSIARGAALSAVVVVVSFVVAEIALRIGEAVLDISIPAPMARPKPEIRYVRHPTRRFTLAPSQQAFSYGAPATVDADGFRANGAPPPDSGAVVLAIGDSFTFGMGVPDSATWPARLERALAARSRRPVRVINAGVISYTAEQEWTTIRELTAERRPDLIVQALYWNDYQNSPPADADILTSDGYFVWDASQETGSAVRRAIRSAMRASHLITMARAVIAGVSGPRGGYAEEHHRLMNGNIPGEWNSVEELYRGLRQLSDSLRVPVQVFLLPVSGLIGRGDTASLVYPRFARELLSRYRIAFVDGFAMVNAHPRPRSLFLPEGAESHFTPEGYQLMADALADRMARDTAIAARLGLVR